MKAKEDYPLVLKAKHIAEIMDVSEPTAYAYMRLKEFPAVPLPGTTKRVHRDRFFDWLEGKQAN